MVRATAAMAARNPCCSLRAATGSSVNSSSTTMPLASGLSICPYFGTNGAGGLSVMSNGFRMGLLNRDLLDRALLNEAWACLPWRREWFMLFYGSPHPCLPRSDM